MPGDTDKKQPWEELGFESFAAYNEDVTKRIDSLTESTKILTESVKEQKESTKAAEKKADEKKEEKEVEEEKDTTEDQWKVKATTLYASLSDDQRKEAEGVIAKLPDDVQAVAKTSFEAKYMILQDMYPDAGDGADDGSVFGALKSKVPSKSPSELIREAMAKLRGVTPGAPSKDGSGFRPGANLDKGKSAESDAKPFDMMAGLYKG